jgi:putative heme-binding domain-containing protein
MAVHPKAELLAHILDPNRSVEGNFRVYTVLTSDGMVINGFLASESRTVLELFDAEGKKQTVLREDIEELVASTKSLMPEGFEKLIPPSQMQDLLELLTQRGKYQPVDMSTIATITSAKGMFHNKDSETERLLFKDWSPKDFQGVPFRLTDPQEGITKNIVLLQGLSGPVSAKMPKSVAVACRQSVRAIHLLSGVSGWGYPANRRPTVSMIVRLHYTDGQTEDHKLKNGIHFADYIARHDVPKSEFAFQLRQQQIRYLSVIPDRSDTIEQIEFIKGPDKSAPVIMAITLETRMANSH